MNAIATEPALAARARAGLSLFARGPLMILPDELPRLSAVGDDVTIAPPPRSFSDWPGYDLVQGVAVITVHGILLQRLGFIGSLGYGPYKVTGYDGLRASLAAALRAPEVRGIVLHVDSPGGDAAGCFDLAEEIRAARAEKPIVAIVDQFAYSAAYALACAAEAITVPVGGGIGSIGVIRPRLDFTRAADAMGMRVELITFGEFKADGNPMQPITAVERSRLQAEIDVLGGLFVAFVAAARNLPAARIAATEAGTFIGQAGVAAGLADAVMAPDAAFRDFLRNLT